MEDRWEADGVSRRKAEAAMRAVESDDFNRFMHDVLEGEREQDATDDGPHGGAADVEREGALFFLDGFGVFLQPFSFFCWGFETTS